MIRRSRRARVATPWANLGKNARNTTEDGFTLIELLIACVVTPLIVASMAMALIAVFSLQGSVTNRITDSGDAQLVSANFESDVQSASLLTTSNSLSPCGSYGQLLGLQSGNGTEITYALNGSELVRNVCSGGSSIPTSTSVVSHDAPTLASGNITANVTCNTTL
jgi:type II secretory pathway pseudopilin PulG